MRSECCGEEMTGGYEDVGICPKCRDHCDGVEDCPECYGMGIVPDATPEKPGIECTSCNGTVEKQ